MQELELVYRKHLQNVRQKMIEKDIDYLFLPLGPEFYYITGTQAPDHHAMMRVWGDWIDGIFLGLERDPILIYHSAYGEKPLYNVSEIFAMPDDDKEPNATLKRAVNLQEARNITIGINKQVWGQTVLALQEAAPHATFAAITEPEFDAVMSMKDEHELSILREAANMTVEIMDGIARFIKTGMRVMDIKVELLSQMTRRGVLPSFGPGIGCVNKDSDPDSRWDQNVIVQPLGVIAFDFGVTYQGYQTDFGRSLFVSEALPDRLRAWSVLTAIVQELTEKMGAGKMTPAEMYHYGVQKARENNLYDGEYGYYQWSIGHAIGLNVHEWPWLREPHESAYQPVKQGMVFCLEPKIFRIGQFYERIEDMILVGKEKGELLTKYTYEPVFVG